MSGNQQLPYDRLHTLQIKKGDLYMFGSLFVDPFVRFIGFIFYFLESKFHSYGLVIIFLSIIVSTILLPLYAVAEWIQQKERNIQLKMKPKIDEYKSVFKGYERYLYISHLYKINNYHPVYALRGLVGLLIQIPFFIGAYAFLSHFTGFTEVPFLFLKDLSQADALLKVGSLYINILPLVMTAVNLLSGYVYGFSVTKHESVSIIFVALFFLVILYTSPSALLLYWTCNNIYNLGKNLVIRSIHTRKQPQGDES